MLGTRGARLGLHAGRLYEMQVRAVVEAALEVSAGGDPPEVEIMLPLIAYPRASSSPCASWLMARSARRSRTGGPHRGRDWDDDRASPAACLVAGAIAAHAEFFSFGTNDLTQTALGLSRDDAERGFLPEYIAARLVARSPFETIDTDGVGELVKIGRRARLARPSPG